MKRILVIVVMAVLFLAVYGFKLQLPTPAGNLEISSGMKVHQPQKAVESPLPVKVVEVEGES